MEKTKLVIIDEHTLAYIQPENPTVANILHASVLRGSPHPAFGQIMWEFKTVRLASEHDFNEYRVSFEGYKNNPDEYEFDPTERRPLDSFQKNFDHHGGVECCLICGKPVKKPYTHWVHLLTTGDLVSSDADFGNDDQGFFPVGSACAKRVGKFAFTNIGIMQPDQHAIDAHVARYPTTDADFGRIPNAPGDRDALLAGRWVDGDASVVLVTDHPEADAIDVAFAGGTRIVAMSPDVEARTFRVDDEVLYSPQHINFEQSMHNQFGVVTSVAGEFPAQKVWVRFNGPGGELTPVDRLIKKTTVFFETETEPDNLGRQRFFLYWPAEKTMNLRGLGAQIFNAVLDDHLQNFRQRGFHAVNWKDRWF